MATETLFQATYSPLKNCSPLWDSSNFVVFLMTLKFAPPLSSSIVFLASWNFFSVAAVRLAKSNWFLCQLCCSWDIFSLRSEISLSFPKKASLRKVISFSLAVKVQEIKVHIMNTCSKRQVKSKFWMMRQIRRTQQKRNCFGRNEKQGFGGIFIVPYGFLRHPLVKWVIMVSLSACTSLIPHESLLQTNR